MEDSYEYSSPKAEENKFLKQINRNKYFFLLLTIQAFTNKFFFKRNIILKYIF